MNKLTSNFDISVSDIDENEESKKIKCENAIKYLNEVDFDKFFNDSIANNAISYLKNTKVRFKKIDSKYQIMFIDTLTSVVIKEWSIISKDGFEVNQIELNGEWSNKINNIKNIILCLKALNNESFECSLYRISLKFKNEFIETLCHMMSSISEIDGAQTHHLLYTSLTEVVGLSLNLIQMISRTIFYYEDEWYKFNLIEILINLSKKFGKEEFSQSCAAIIRDIYNYNKIDNENKELINETKNIDGHDDDDDDDVNKLLERKNAFNFILQSNDRVEILMSDQLFLKSIKYLSNNSDIDWFDSLADDEQLEFLKIIMKLLEYLLKILIEDIKRLNMKHIDVESEAKLVKTYSLMNYLIGILICTYLESIQFSIKYNKNNASFKLIFSIVTNQNLLNILDEEQTNHHLLSYLQNRLVESCLDCLDCLKQYANKFKSNWYLLGFNSNFCFLETISKHYGYYTNRTLELVPYTIDYSDDDDETQFLNLSIYQKVKLSEENDNKKALEIAFNTLKEYSKYPQKIFESRKVLDAIDFINKNYFAEEYNVCLIEFAYNLIKYGLKELINEIRNLISKSQNNFDETEIKVIKYSNIYQKIFGEVTNKSNNSIEFCINFHEFSDDSIKILFEIINSQILISFFLKKNSDISAFLEQFYRNTFSSLHNISRVAYKYKKTWMNLKSFDILLQLSERLQTVDEFYQFISILTIANIASNDELNNLSESINILGNIAKILKSFALELISPEFERDEIQIDENDKQTYALITFDGWNLAEIIEACKNLAVNDRIKGVIYDILNVKEHLRTIIYNGNEVEQECALKLLHQLCFDKKIAQNVRDDTKLSNFLQNILVNGTVSQRKGLRKNCEGIMWLVNFEDRTKTTMDSDIARNTKHIMISYNSGSRELCLEIKKKLESFNHKIWIDVENIHGSTIDAMAKAVEEAWCILVCMTEKYKASENCRLEAEYVMQLKKPFVPLIMQKNYKADGWLGLMLGTKVYIDFTKNDFDECVKSLVKELNSHFQKQNSVSEMMISSKERIEINTTTKEEIVIKQNIQSPKQIVIKQQAAYFWHENEVEKWLDEKKIPITIKSNIWPSNGKVLEQLYSMYINVPEFYYSVLRSDTNANIKEIAIFTSELKLLFA